VAAPDALGRGDVAWLGVAPEARMLLATRMSICSPACKPVNIRSLQPAILSIIVDAIS
jgi:hypothetical protein